MIYRSISRRWIYAAVAVVTAAVSGCGGGDAGPPRVAVSGEVTYRGAPVEKGAILFIPIDETRGPRAGAVIDAGRFHIESGRGPVVGQLRVEIRADVELGYDITEPTQSVRHIGEPWPKQPIPAVYNDESILVVETTADGDNTFEFHLPVE